MISLKRFTSLGIFGGFAISMGFLVTVSDVDTCTIARKLVYVSIYIGFFAYDIYQYLRIKALTLPGPCMLWSLRGMLVVRFASYGYNIWAVAGVVATKGLILRDRTKGPCTTGYAFNIYLRHRFVRICQY